jgi:Tol biopolymer transport system component
LTTPGLVIGTVAYMSPEQARGEELDARSDIFSLGAVLFEMATGQLAFTGKTSAMTFKAILDETPVPPSQLNKALPQKLDEIVGKALEKDPDLRYQSAAELRTDLKRLKRDTDSGRIRGAVQEPPLDPRTRSIATGEMSIQLRVKRYAALAASIVLLATAIAGYRFWPHSSTPSVSAKITQISQWNKRMNDATLSPDGHTVAFDSPVRGISQVFLMLTSGGEPLQLTNNEGAKRVDNFSADGKEVYYARNLGRDEIWAVPALGGSPRRVVSGYHAVPSPDGTSIFYMKSDSPGIFRAANSGLNEELAYKPDDAGRVSMPISLFPGGNDLLVVSSRYDSSNARLFRLNLTNHKPVDLGEISEISANFDLVWDEPGNSILFSRSVNGLANLWKYSLRERRLTQITFGTGPDYSPMPEPEGKRIYYVNGKSSGFLTAYHVRSKESRDIVSEDARSPEISPDGKRVMYITIAGPQKTQLWASDIDGGNKVRIASGEELHTGVWAPDNFHLSFFEFGASVEHNAYIAEADANGLHQIPSMGGSPFVPVWSPDMKTVYVSVLENVGWTFSIWKWSVDGSNTEKLVDKCGYVSDVDAGGQYLLGVEVVGETTGIYEVSVSDRKCISLLPGKATYASGSSRTCPR